MGQGLNTKIAQIAASEMGVSLDRIKVNATNTSKVPNTFRYGCISRDRSERMAVKNAIDILRARIVKLMASEFSKSYPAEASAEKDILIKDNTIFDNQYPERKISFAGNDFGQFATG